VLFSTKSLIWKDRICCRRKNYLMINCKWCWWEIVNCEWKLENIFVRCSPPIYKSKWVQRMIEEKVGNWFSREKNIIFGRKSNLTLATINYAWIYTHSTAGCQDDLPRGALLALKIFSLVWNCWKAICFFYPLDKRV